MASKDFQYIIQKLNQFPFDIRIEVLMADLLDSGMNDDDIILQPVSVFKRRFGKDLHKAKLLIDKQDNENILFELTRDGIYDLLPEGLFHQPRDRKHYKNTSDMVYNVKVQRQEEQAARQLFVPMENELFQLRAYLERAEKRMFYELENNASNDFLIQFWNLSKFKQYPTIAILVRFMPILYRLTASLEYIKLCYEILLKQVVSIEIVTPYKHYQTNATNCWKLGNEYLSYTTTVGNQIKSDLPEYNITIGPIENEEIDDYLPHGTMYAYLQLLNSYFLPMGYEKNIIIQPKSKNNFVDLENQFLHLGINTILN